MTLLAEASALEYLTKPYVIFWVAIFSVPVVGAVATAWTKVRVREEELRAIAHLAEKGYSADEIERLVGRKDD